MDNGISYEELSKQFENDSCWGLVTSVDLIGCNPEKIRSESVLKQFVAELCELIQMKRFGDTQVVHFGEDEKVAGYSVVQLIETSLVSGHLANQTNNAYWDVFSCKLYNPQDVLNFAVDFFEAKDSEVSVLLRRGCFYSAK